MHEAFDERRYLIPFRSALLPQIFTDVLVIGSGVAGLSAAATAARDADVIVLAKGKLDQSNTAWAQGGIAAVMDAADSIDEHVANTLDAGAGLCDEPVVRHIIENGPRAIRELIDLGMPFDRDNEGHLHLGREGGHTAHRILHADGDATGKALAHTMIANAKHRDRIRLFDNCFALDLLTSGNNGHPGRCLGAITHHPKYGLQMIWAKATILASGGCGQVYRESTNPAVATGDGVAMAYRAGARLADLEFMQFHPTVLYVAGADRKLITEAVRGEGAYLVDRNGERFMPAIHELAELAPRDIVSRAILDQLAKGVDNKVYLDARHIGRARFAERFPGITALLDDFEIDPGTDLIPIRPAAHYMIGGVWADDDARTSIEGLYACGEASCTGLNGANRLASNSLLEGLVCGQTAAVSAREMLDRVASAPATIVSDIRPSDRTELDLADVKSTLRSVMWRQVGIVRDGQRLDEVAEMFDFWARYTLDKIFDDRAGWETQNMLTLGALMTRAAAARTESRGTHYRADFPNTDDAQKHHTLWTRGKTEPDHINVREGAAVGK
ncbi:MAG: L-aspartate oxidase [Phycisphaera sp.]|nr:L-aspartate oxidase [Phycisphaera sp.]